MSAIDVMLAYDHPPPEFDASSAVRFIGAAVLAAGARPIEAGSRGSPEEGRTSLGVECQASIAIEWGPAPTHRAVSVVNMRVPLLVVWWEELAEYPKAARLFDKGTVNGYEMESPFAAKNMIVDFLMSLGGAVSTDHSEELVRQLYVLLDQKDSLIAALTTMYENDRRQAEATIKLLEGQLASLEAAALETKPRWRQPMVVATLAMAVATVLGPVSAAFTEHQLGPQVDKVIEQAQTVQQECDINVDIHLDETGRLG